LIELAASMLDQLVDNPCVLYEGKLNHVEMCLDIYQVACETNTIYPIIRRFLEICSNGTGCHHAESAWK